MIARARAHLQKGNHYFAYRDIDAVLRLNEEDIRAIRVRAMFHQATGRAELAESDFAFCMVRPQLPPTGREQTHLTAGYHVVTRFEPYSAAPEVLISTYPLDSLSEALADADRFAYDPQKRRELVELGVIHTSDCDTLVYEVRSVVREVQNYGALDDEGDPLEVKETTAGCGGV